MTATLSSRLPLRAGKAVFLEKPMGLTREEINDVWEAGGANARLVIGFNRRFPSLDSWSRRCGPPAAPYSSSTASLRLSPSTTG